MFVLFHSDLCRLRNGRNGFNMNTFIKRATTLLFAIVFLFALSASALASEIIQPRIDFVATMLVVSAPSSGISSGSGHAFLVIKNTSDSEITVGHMPVGTHDSVTIGTFGNRSAHCGIWYNVEGYHRPSPSYGLLMGVTPKDLATINRTINSNDSWSLSNNCSSFAAKVWNAVNPTKNLSGGTPAILANNIQYYCDQAGYYENPEIPSKARSTIARHTTTSYVYDPSGAFSS